MVYFGVFGLQFGSNIVRFEISTLAFVSFQVLEKKMKIPKFGGKKALFGYFWVRSLNYFFIFEVSTFQFVKVRNFMKK